MYRKSMKVIANGEEIELYTIGHTATLLKKSVETLRAWERQKVIPKPMYRNKQVRLYHPLEVEAMRKVIKKLGKHPKKEDTQREMWAAVRDARREILNGKQQQDNNNGDKVHVSSEGTPNAVQQEIKQDSPPDVLANTEVQSPSHVPGMSLFGDTK